MPTWQVDPTWNMDTLKVLMDEREARLNRLMDERDRNQRREMDHLAQDFREHIKQARVETEFALEASDKAIAKAEISTEKAIEKAALATDNRFASVNAFRDQLADQAAMFMPRQESMALHSRTDERITTLSRHVSSSMTREEVVALSERNAERVQDLTDRLNRSEGKGAGLNGAWVYALGALAALGTLVSMFVLFTR